MSVRLGSASTNSGGTVVDVKQALGWSDGDVALLELESPYQNTYVGLAASNLAVGARGDIYGWGAVDAKPTYKNKLKTAEVKIDSLSDTRYGPSVVERGVDGQALWGDSGGPLIVDGKVVGVCSGPIEGKPGTITGTVAYSSVIAAGSWIESTSGGSGS